MKYTIIYADTYALGKTITKYDYVETDNLSNLLNSDKYHGNVWFVFEGHCKEQK